MADKIKKFFQRKKADARFKLAGPGHKLNDSSGSIRTPEPKKDTYKVKPRSELTAEAKQAAEAALARLGQRKDDTAFNTSLAAIQAQVRRELEAEKKLNALKITEEKEEKKEVKEVELEASPLLAVSGVYFRCSLIGNEILSKEEWKRKIKEFLYEQLENERGLTACLMIHSLNTREKAITCIETLCKYLENIMANPDEEKYHRIRMSNRVFCDKVQPVEGSLELLHAAGFRQQRLKLQDAEEDYLVFDKNNSDSDEMLQLLIDALHSAEPIALDLDRNMQVLLPSQASKKVELPPAFFSISPEEIKREQQLKAEAMEKSMQLRTKAMREREEMREMRKYRFALIRVRFPDGVYLQGTFAVYEKLSCVMDFVRENLEHEGIPFVLTNATGQRLHEEDYEKTLVDLRLVPASILTFAWDPYVVDDLGSASSTYLKPEVMMLVQSL